MVARKKLIGWLINAESLWLAMREGLQRKCRRVALLVNNQLHTGIVVESPTRRGTPEYKFWSLKLQSFKVSKFRFDPFIVFLFSMVENKEAQKMNSEPLMIVIVCFATSLRQGIFRLFYGTYSVSFVGLIRSPSHSEYVWPE